MKDFKTVDREKAVEYSSFELHPFFHQKEKMPWAAASVVNLEQTKNLIFCSGATGRDPERDRQPRDFEEVREGVGKVLGDVREQTRGTWNRIKETLEELDSRLKDIVFIRYYLVNRHEWWDMWDETHDFFKEHCPDLAENPRAATLLEEVELDLPDMKIEIEVVAAQPKEQ